MHESIESAFAQTYLNVEVIVVDDGSTDNTKEVALSHSIKYIYIQHRGRATSAHARNIGLSSCGGKFVVFLDADDKIGLDYLEKCYNRYANASENHKVAFIWTGYQAFGNSKEISLPVVNKLTPLNCIYPGGQIGAMLVLRNIYDVVGNYDESLQGLEDLEWVIRASKKGYIGYSIKEPLHYYRFHGKSVNVIAKEMNLVNDLFRRYPSFRLMYELNRWSNIFRFYLAMNKEKLIRLYNATAVRFLNAPRIDRPPSNTRDV